ncbi:MAG TPA: MbtH family protein [Pyrinomonadaceae bacterium]|jgi:MbtH protein
MSTRDGDEPDDTTYRVVVDHEGRRSIWPADRETPLGWGDAGKSGSKQECLDYVKDDSAEGRPAGPGEAAGPGQDAEPGWRGDL